MNQELIARAQAFLKSAWIKQIMWLKQLETFHECKSCGTVSPHEQEQFIVETLAAFAAAERDAANDKWSNLCSLLGLDPWNTEAKDVVALRDAAVEECCKAMCYLCAGKHNNYNPQPIFSEEYKGFYHIALDAKTDKQRDVTMSRCKAEPIRFRATAKGVPHE